MVKTTHRHNVTEFNFRINMNGSEAKSLLNTLNQIKVGNKAIDDIYDSLRDELIAAGFKI